MSSAAPRKWIDAPIRRLDSLGQAAIPRTGICGGFLDAACGAREKLRRAEPAASGRKVPHLFQRGAPACRDPLLKRPGTGRVDAPRPASRPTEASPPRYGEGGQRSRRGCSDPRMPGSEGMDLWRTASQGPRSSGSSHSGERPRRVPEGKKSSWERPCSYKESGNMDRVSTDKKGRKADCRAKSERGKPALVDASAGTIHRPEREGWWRRRGLNPRPPRCERGALPTELLPHLAVSHSLRFGPLCQNHFSAPAKAPRGNPRTPKRWPGTNPRGNRFCGYRKPSPPA